MLFSPNGELVALAAGTGLHLFDGYSLEMVDIIPSGYTSYAIWSADSSLLALCSTSGGND